jgi:hypothetical protein
MLQVGATGKEEEEEDMQIIKKLPLIPDDPLKMKVHYRNMSGV